MKLNIKRLIIAIVSLTYIIGSLALLANVMSKEDPATQRYRTFSRSEVVPSIAAPGGKRSDNAPLDYIPPHTVISTNEFRTVIHKCSKSFISITLAVGVGGLQDPSDQKGVSHLLEHVCTSGTGGTSFLSQVDNLGGELRAYTTISSTYYTITVPQRQLYRAVDILYSMAKIMDYTDKVIEKDKNIVIAEIHDHLNSGGSARSFIDNDLAFWKIEFFSLGRDKCSNIGSAATVRSLTKSELIAHKKRHYVPANMTLQGIGNIDEKPFMQAVANTFGTLPQAKSPNTYSSAIDPDRLRISRTPTKSSHLLYSIRFKLYEYDEADYLNMTFLKEFLKHYLFYTIREQFHNSYGTNLYIDTYNNNACFSIVGIYHKNSVEEVKSIIYTTLHQLRAGSFDAEIFGKYKKLVVSNQLLGYPTTNAEISDLAVEWSKRKLYTNIPDNIGFFNSTNLSSIQDFLRKTFVYNRIVIYEQIPFSTPLKLAIGVFVLCTIICLHLIFSPVGKVMTDVLWVEVLEFSWISLTQHIAKTFLFGVIVLIGVSVGYYFLATDFVSGSRSWHTALCLFLFMLFAIFLLKLYTRKATHLFKSHSCLILNSWAFSFVIDLGKALSNNRLKRGFSFCGIPLTKRGITYRYGWVFWKYIPSINEDDILGGTPKASPAHAIQNRSPQKDTLLNMIESCVAPLRQHPQWNDRYLNLIHIITYALMIHHGHSHDAEGALSIKQQQMIKKGLKSMGVQSFRKYISSKWDTCFVEHPSYHQLFQLFDSAQRLE